MSFVEFLTMGKHGAYVWPAFGIAAIVLIWNVVAARRLHARARAEALRRAQSAEGRP